MAKCSAKLTYGGCELRQTPANQTRLPPTEAGGGKSYTPTLPLDREIEQQSNPKHENIFLRRKYFFQSKIIFYFLSKDNVLVSSGQCGQDPINLLPGQGDIWRLVADRIIISSQYPATTPPLQQLRLLGREGKYLYQFAICLLNFCLQDPFYCQCTGLGVPYPII